jgi:hypothetical protein
MALQIDKLRYSNASNDLRQIEGNLGTSEAASPLARQGP